VFYTSKFQGAVEILRWLCLGMTLRVISWPMGIIIVAKGVQNLIIFSELAWTFVYLGLAWICVSTFSLEGAGIAFFGSYIFHVAMIYAIVRRLSGFRWSSANMKTSCLFLTLITVIFCSFYIFPPLWAMGVGALAVLLSGIYSIQVLLNLISMNNIPLTVQKLLKWFRLNHHISNKNNDLELENLTALKNKPITSTWLLSVFMLCTVFSMWLKWYEDAYGWSIELASFESEFKLLISIFQ
jgi:PST family polysaccharide transporter